MKRILKMLYNYAGTTVVRSLFFHKHHDYANNLKNKLSKLLESEWARENEKRLETALGHLRTSPSLFPHSLPLKTSH